MTLLTIAEYARHRGCDEKAVRKAIAEGRITRIGSDRRCIDPDVADIQWAKNTRARGDSGKVPGHGQRPPGTTDPEPNGEDYSSMRARRERAEAMMAEIELAKASGKTLDRESALRAIYTKFRELRDTSLVIGRTLAPRLAPMTDEREIRLVIDRAVADAFDTFARRSMQSLVDGMVGAPTALPAELSAGPGEAEAEP